MNKVCRLSLPLLFFESTTKYSSGFMFIFSLFVQKPFDPVNLCRYCCLVVGDDSVQAGCRLTLIVNLLLFQADVNLMLLQPRLLFFDLALKTLKLGLSLSNSLSMIGPSARSIASHLLVAFENSTLLMAICFSRFLWVRSRPRFATKD